MTQNAVITRTLRSNDRLRKFWQLNRKSSEEIRYYCHNQAKPDVQMDLKAIKGEKTQVILPISNKTLELKNLVTKEEYRNKGYAKRLLKH